MKNEEIEVNISVGSASRSFYWDCTYRGTLYSGSIIEYYDSEGEITDSEFNWYNAPDDHDLKDLLEEHIDNELNDEWNNIIKD